MRVDLIQQIISQPVGYYYEIFLGPGCTLTDSVFIPDPPALDAGMTLYPPLCYGGTGQATVDTVYNWQGNYNNISFIWVPNPGGVGGVWADSSYNMPAGTYALIINDDNGCSNTIDFTITQPTELVLVQFGSEPAYCRMSGYQSGNGVVDAAAAGGTPARVLVNNEMVRLDSIEQHSLDNKDILLIIDRIVVKEEEEFYNRLADAVQTAFFEGKGECYLQELDTNKRKNYNTNFTLDGINFLEPNIHLFSFNNPYGACPTCEGYGNIIGVDEELVIPNSAMSVYENAIYPWRGESMKLVQRSIGE